MKITYSFGERVFDHQRSMGTAGSSDLQRALQILHDQFRGGFPLWEVLRCTLQRAKRPTSSEASR